MSTKDELRNYASRKQKRWFVICRSFLHGVACSEAVVNVSDKARRLRLSDGDHFEVPESYCSTTPLASPLPRVTSGVVLAARLVFVLSARVCFVCSLLFFLAGKAVRRQASERYPPELIDVMALFPGFPPCCCCCSWCSSPCALPVPPGTLTRRFGYTWTDTSTSRFASCGELPSEWLQILFVLERGLIGPGCSSRFYAPARVGVSAPLLCRGR